MHLHSAPDFRPQFLTLCYAMLSVLLWMEVKREKEREIRFVRSAERMHVEIIAKQQQQ